MKRIFILSLLILFAATMVAAQNNYVDSLKQKLGSSKEDSNKVKLLISISEPYMWNKPDTAIKYGLQAWQLAQQLKYDDGILSVSSVLSEAFSTKGNYSKALEIVMQAMQVAKKMGTQDDFGFSIGNVYFYSGDYNKALDYYLKAIKSQPVPGKVILGVIGESYYHLDNLDSALFYINKSYQIDKNSRYHWSVPYYYMALIESKKRDFNSALANYRLGLLYASKRAVLDIVNGYNGIAVVFKQTGQLDSSIFYSKKAILLGQKNSIAPGVMDASALLTELYLKINIDSAFKYQRMMLAIKDSLFSGEKVKQLENISFNEQMRQNEIQQKEKEYQNKLKIYGLIAALIAFLIIVVVIYRNNRHKQKAFAILQKQKQEIDIQKEKVEQTLEELKSTQKQLIQSEKMASLGELTAGIAHEIQNPLNFVNNFSDVNKELLVEMKDEILADNKEDAIAIANDVIENEQKINHHGKRADAIVKGMLQHSRTSTGQKELTDINALCDEYLRLSYHGMRAKDKSFNAEMKTDFDQSIGKINIVAQDIGRVILNLINNAFYACAKRSRSAVNEGLRQAQPDIHYEPTVTVTTGRSPLSFGEGRGEVFIKVKDNGPGIPQKVIDKIFQPFFTTKPTGEGTGLGLSLAYDIVKAHGGEIKVNTKVDDGNPDKFGEGKFTEFVVLLPL